MHRGYIQIAALLGAISVALGAFAAHKLKAVFSEYSMGIFETGVRYQFYHVFALLAVGILFAQGNKKWMNWSGIFFICGTILFSGSLYLLAWVKTASVDNINWIGPITPLGGLCFILGWISLFLGFYIRKND